jgi:hypothetical protein
MIRISDALLLYEIENQKKNRLRRCIPNENDFSAEQPLEKEDPWLP